MRFSRFKSRNFTKPITIAKLLPNLVTLLGLIIGVSSIRFALDSQWEMAIYCIIGAIIFDGLDGRIARLFNATSHFGAELDSLCDFVNFGLCPAMLIYLWSFQQYEYKVISWAAIMLYIVCMAIRLARFNASIDQQPKDYNFFVGMPAPSGALLASIPLIIDFEISTLIPEFSLRNHTLVIDLYIVLIALLLASRLPTFSLKNIKIQQEFLSYALVIAGLFFIITIIFPWYVLPIISIIYILTIPVCYYKATNKNKAIL